MSSLPSPALLGDLRQTLASLGQRFTAAGHDLYLVGGVVRDALLGATASPDVDLTTDATPSEILQVVEPLADDLWRQGERFGTIGLRAGELGGLDLEITTYRAEQYDPTTRKPVVEFGTDILVDLERRDFTINAMAVAVADGAIIDPFNGRADLEARVLRTPGPPAVSFSDDPLRLLRAARFLARFGLVADPDLVAAAVEHRDRLAIVSVERIRGEIERLLELPQPEAGLRFLRDLRLLDQVRPTGDLPDEVIRRVTECSDTVVRRAALWSDCAEPEVRNVLRKLRFSTVDQRYTTMVLAAARQLLELDSDDPAADGVLRRAALGLDDEPAGTDRVVALAGAIEPERATGWEQRLASLRAVEDLADLGPPLQGGDLMNALGLEPGPEVGRLVKALLEARLDEGPMSRDEALATAVRLRR